MSSVIGRSTSLLGDSSSSSSSSSSSGHRNNNNNNATTTSSTATADNDCYEAHVLTYHSNPFSYSQQANQVSQWCACAHTHTGTLAHTPAVWRVLCQY